MRLRLLAVCGLFSLLGSGCWLLGGGGGADGGLGGGAGGGGGGGGGAGGGSACVPLQCGSTGALCGMVADGCGRTLNCGTCSCTPSTYQADCPSRPCQQATGCTANACVYEPVTCNFTQCTGCTGADGGACGDAELRACGPGCADSYCDPSPGVLEGKTTYGNTCRTRGEVRCGTCQLGGLACTPDGGAATCQGITLTGVNPELVECNGSSPAATVLFVDPSATSAAHTGGKDAPFLTFDEAVAAAGVRGSRAIVIGGAPTFNQVLVLSSGVSVLGGFAGYPAWVRDDSRRPVFSAPAASLAGGVLAGVRATGITSPTEVSHLDVVTPDLTGTAAAEGAANVGALVQGSPALAFTDVRFTVGAGQRGAGGATGGSQGAVLPFSAGGSVGVGGAYASCAAAFWDRVPGGAGQAPTCGGSLDPLGAGGNGATVVKASNSMPTFFTQGGASPGGAQGGLASANGATLVPGPGQDGPAAATAAAPGAGGSPALGFTAGAPRALGRGGAGATGKVGIGGGGGGGGMSSQFSTAGGTDYCFTGGGGGAGGAGGCGGLGGTGGHPGGWSIGIAQSASPGLLLRRVVVSVGPGGQGGGGGPGGAGTPGAAGGSAGPLPAGAPTGVYLGSQGGRGASGQTGGAGGSGASGQARGAACDAPGLDLTGVTFGTTPAGFLTSEGC